MSLSRIISLACLFLFLLLFLFGFIYLKFLKNAPTSTSLPYQTNENNNNNENTSFCLGEVPYFSDSLSSEAGSSIPTPSRLIEWNLAEINKTRYFPIKINHETLIGEGATAEKSRIDYYYQISECKLMVGLLVTFHGCSHTGKDWFTLPEERRIVAYALSHGFSVLAITANDISSGCWDSYPKALDHKHVRAAITHFLDKFPELNSLPKYGLGASSGGSFVLSINNLFTSITVQISPGPTNWQLSLNDPSVVSAFPTVAWLYMSKDTKWASKQDIQTNKLMLKKYSILSQMWESPSHILTPLYLYQRINNFSESFSENFYNLAKTGGFLTEEGYLSRDPRQTLLARQLCTQLNAAYNTDIFCTEYYYALEEEMNVLYGQHELTSEHWPQILGWMIKNNRNKTII